MNAYGIVSVVTLSLLVGLVGWWKQRRHLLGTTLVAPWCWTVIALLGLCASELFIELLGREQNNWRDAMRLAVACLSICPAIALLGARRPHDGAWQFIVLTFWFVAAMPAGESLVKPDQPISISAARSWFFLGVLLLTFVNHLGSTRWSMMCCWAAAQVALFFPYLPFGDATIPDSWRSMAPILMAVAIWLDFRQFQGSRTDSGWQRVWLDYRDYFGALWMLRNSERLNAVAVMYAWEVRIGWNGFVSTADDHLAVDLPESIVDAFSTASRNLLRRFVSESWIADRLGEQVDSTSIADSSLSAKQDVSM